MVNVFVEKLDARNHRFRHGPLGTADRESLYRFIRAVNDLEVCYTVVEACQHSSRFRFDNGFLRFVSCELTDGLHRLPNGQYDKFDGAVNRTAEQVGSAMSCDCSKRRENFAGCMPNIFAWFLGG